jgi:ABC-type lipoprotein export system ATPase subunit
MKVDLNVSVPVSRSSRARQLEGMFDVPISEKAERHWSGNVPIEDKNWNVGLIVGPSGCGKTSIAKDIWGLDSELEWPHDQAVIDGFDEKFSMNDISQVCSSVGFNTIPAWLRPFRVLSNGEQFRATLARRLLESSAEQPLVFDEFTSVVDRQVAQIGSHAVQKWVRKNKHQFVAVTCHYDVEEWLQPDWILEPSTMAFSWRSVQPRPRLNITIEPCEHSVWKTFAPFHYLTNQLHKAARCYVLKVEGQPAAFAGVIHRPHAANRRIKNVTRLVTLPDWQGLGLAFVLMDHLGAMYAARKYTFTINPAHPALVRAFDKSPLWKMTVKPGMIKSNSQTSTLNGGAKVWITGGRTTAGFKYAGPASDDVVFASQFIKA